ncbi:MAG: Xaa-Pro peptidase family protein [Ignavibacteriae bacterium]|nr:Xaa-Pro peptidase family protein [Ignavibacteriota bacterium]
MNSQRLDALRRKLSTARLDAFLVTFLPHVRYLSGFSGSNGICIITRSNQVFLTDGRYREQVKDEVRGFRIVVASESLFVTAVQKQLIPRNGRIGYESQHLTVIELRNLKKLLPKAIWTATNGLVEDIAVVKDDSEIRLLKQVVTITDRVFEQLLNVIKPGVRELEVAAEASYLHRMAGSEADAFEPIVASGKRGALPHARATDKKIAKGELVTIDMGGRFQGYHSDLTRTVAVGKPSPKARRMYQVVADAQQLAIEAAGSGISGKALDAVARSHIKKNGYGKYFNHSLGHGLGLQIHEQPRLSVLSKDMLVEGNVVTIEPGVYMPGVGGVRIEDDVVIRRGHCEVLNKAPKELIIL